MGNVKSCAQMSNDRMGPEQSDNDNEAAAATAATATAAPAAAALAAAASASAYSNDDSRTVCLLCLFSRSASIPAARILACTSAVADAAVAGDDATATTDVAGVGAVAVASCIGNDGIIAPSTDALASMT